MRANEPGLRHRLRRTLRQIEEQHRALRPLFEELEGAFEHAELASILEWLERYRNALEAHFTLEEDVLFPGLQGLDPAAESEIVALGCDHGRHLDVLADLDSRLRGSFGRPEAELLRSLSDGLQAHERREIALVERILIIDS